MVGPAFFFKHTKKPFLSSTNASNRFICFFPGTTDSRRKNNSSNFREKKSEKNKIHCPNFVGAVGHVTSHFGGLLSGPFPSFYQFCLPPLQARDGFWNHLNLPAHLSGELSLWAVVPQLSNPCSHKQTAFYLFSPFFLLLQTRPNISTVLEA